MRGDDSLPLLQRGMQQAFGLQLRDKSSISLMNNPFVGAVQPGQWVSKPQLLSLSEVGCNERATSDDNPCIRNRTPR